MAQAATLPQPPSLTPDYAELTRFLLRPFLDHPDLLRVDCEVSAAKARVWIRVAFHEDDRGRAFGRGGRNVQAIRKVLDGIAQAANQTIRFEVYGGQPQENERSMPQRRSSKPYRDKS
ncbi:KH domain-containing protein [Alkalinema pantanalense CENA528]|uniref:KH domain-containing protein n=1 Tax=Alkalinema pantanalense TaxID=1620705 RepID=UPI003D6DDB43